VKVRDATVADVTPLTALHTAAFEGQMGPLIGDRYIRAFLRWFIENPSAVSLVAELDGQPAGYVFGAPDGYGPGLTRTLMPTIAAGVLRNLPKVVLHQSFARQVRSRLSNLILRREPTNRIFANTPAGCFCLVGIGTHRAFRGRGVASALIGELIARSRGGPVLLDVFKDNIAARSVYEQCGFRVLVEEGRVIRMINRPL